MPRARFAATLLAVLGLAGIAIAAAGDIPAVGDPQSIVDVRDVKVEADEVSGVLVNRSSKPVRNVQVQIVYSWLWNNERHPPDADDPGRTVSYTVRDEIPPGGRLPFTYRPDTHAPQRSDGRFETSVSVVALEQMG